MPEKSFVRKHIIGWVCAAVTTVAGVIGSKIYFVYRGPVESQIAAGQVADSNTAFALHQAAQSDLFPTLIGMGALVIVFIFMLPTLLHLLKMIKDGDV
jgi:hypothetical protein